MNLTGRMFSFLMLALVLGIGVSAADHHSEQLIFSGHTGSTAFWIWCEFESDNPYAGECNGAMQVNGTSQHVIDSVVPTEGAEGIYTISVVGTGKNPIACTLVNAAAPVNGPNNTVTVNCSSPAISETTNSAVVHATGPA